MYSRSRHRPIHKPIRDSPPSNLNQSLFQTIFKVLVSIFQYMYIIHTMYTMYSSSIKMFKCGYFWSKMWSWCMCFRACELLNAIDYKCKFTHILFAKLPHMKPIKSNLELIILRFHIFFFKSIGVLTQVVFTLLGYILLICLFYIKLTVSNRGFVLKMSW